MSETIPNILAEFSNPKLVSVYNAVNQHYPQEKQFYLDFAHEIQAKKIIVVGCGTGLLTLALANLGYEMVGIEPAQAMLEVANQSPNASKVKWIQGDALILNEENADLAMMTAHVAQFLLEDEYFLKCLTSINKSLKNGGYLVFDSRNAIAEIAHLGWPTAESPRKGENLNGEDVSWWPESLETNGNRVRYKIHYLFNQTGERYESVNELIFRTEEEITEFLIKAGFKVEKVYGDWDKSELSSKSPEFIFIAKKM